MARPPAEDVTNTELAILQVLWDQGETTRRRVADVVYPGGGESHYATVQNLLGRLERQGLRTIEPSRGTSSHPGPTGPGGSPAPCSSHPRQEVEPLSSPMQNALVHDKAYCLGCPGARSSYG